MLLLAVIGLLLIIVGSSVSIFRSSSTIDYYRTMLRDGRDDDHAKRIMFGYYAGLVGLNIGAVLIVLSIFLK